MALTTNYANIGFAVKVKPNKAKAKRQNKAARLNTNPLTAAQIAKLKRNVKQSPRAVVKAQAKGKVCYCKFSNTNGGFCIATTNAFANLTIAKQRLCPRAMPPATGQSKGRNPVLVNYPLLAARTMYGAPIGRAKTIPGKF